MQSWPCKKMINRLPFSFLIIVAAWLIPFTQISQNFLLIHTELETCEFKQSYSMPISLSNTPPSSSIPGTLNIVNSFENIYV